MCVSNDAYVAFVRTIGVFVVNSILVDTSIRLMGKLTYHVDGIFVWYRGGLIKLALRRPLLASAN
jgi:hypothetical protein